MEKTKIFLIRHAETVDNKAGIPLGQNDSPLTAEGKKQAQKTADYLSNFNIQAIYTSDLGRAQKTAEIIGQKLSLEPINVPEFRELDLGNWQGLGFNEIKFKMIKQTRLSRKDGIPINKIRPQNGENTYDHKKRVIPKFNQIIENHQGETTVVIAHSGTNKLILGAIKQLPVGRYYQINQDNCTINLIHASPDGFEVIKINNGQHLK